MGTTERGPPDLGVTRGRRTSREERAGPYQAPLSAPAMSSALADTIPGEPVHEPAHNDDAVGMEINDAAKQADIRLPPDIVGSLKKKVSEAKDNLRKYLKAIDREKRLTSEQAELAQGRYPAGVPHVKCGYTCAQVDEVFTSTDRKFEVTVPAGCTHREARDVLWQSYLQMERTVDLSTTQMRKWP